MELKYARGFHVTNYPTYKILQISKPWPKSTKTFSYLLLKDGFNSNLDTFIKNEKFDGIFKIPIKKIIVTSTTHIPSLEMLNVENSLIGFPECHFISSPKTRQRIASGHIYELGKNENLNTETILELNPNVIVSFGIEGVNKALETVKKAKIPVIYNGDWSESTPLAKAEWIKLFGVIFNKEFIADSIFNQIEIDYNKAKTIAFKSKNSPTVLSGALNGNVWFLPAGNSTEAQLLKDANVNYFWKNTSGTGSLSLSFEEVFNTARKSEYWINPSNYKSYNALNEANRHYFEFDAFKNRKAFTIARKKGTTGGTLYYEFGTARPDLVLKDLIKIFHPESLVDYTPVFYQPLE